MLIDLGLIIVGMAMLVKGGSWLVDGASRLARRYKISELAIGLTIVAFGTSAPEMIVSLVASVDSHPEIALGNVIGSNNFNLLFILGVTALIAPVAVHRNTVRMEIPFSLLAAVLLLLLGNAGFIGGGENIIGRIESVILLVFFGIFVYYVYKNMKADDQSSTTTDASGDDQSSITALSVRKSLIYIILGLVLLIVGGKVVVNAAVDFARALHISEKVIGLTIIAVGTSLPELVTSVTAIIKKRDDIAVGNIIGSNIFNIFLIIGVCAMVHPIDYSPVFNRDIYLLIFGTLLLLLAMFTGKKRQLDRWQGFIFVLLYVAYVIYLIMMD